MMPTHSDDDLMSWLTHQLDYHADAKQPPPPPPPPPPPQPPPAPPTAAGGFPACAEERLTGGGGTVSFSETDIDANMNTEEHVVRAILEEEQLTSSAAYPAIGDPTHDLGAIEEAFNSDAARQLFSATSSVSLDFDLGNLLSEYRVGELMAEGSGGLSLNERRMRMRRQLSAPGELTPQLQQLNIRVKDEPDRTCESACRERMSPGDPRRRSIAVNNPLLASLLESSGASAGVKSRPSQCLSSHSVASPPSFAGDQQHPAFGGVPPPRAAISRTASAPCHVIKQEKQEPPDGLDSDGGDLADFMCSSGGSGGSGNGGKYNNFSSHYSPEWTGSTH